MLSALNDTSTNAVGVIRFILEEATTITSHGSRNKHQQQQSSFRSPASSMICSVVKRE
jgi:hypothetical protein